MAVTSWGTVSPTAMLVLVLAATKGPVCFSNSCGTLPTPAPGSQALALLVDRLALEATWQLTTAQAVTPALAMATVTDKS